jgi:hypothetical protein
MASKIKVKNLGNHITKEQEEKWFKIFCARAGYMGNGIYKVDGLYSTDTRELFLMFVAQQEEIPFENE